MECRVESLMRNEVLLEYEVGFMFPKRPYQEELEARILKLIDDQEDQIRKLEKDMRKTKDTFMCLADSLIATLKVKIEAQRAHSIKIKKITKFPTHTPTVTPKILKPSMVNMVSMISNTKPTIYRYPHQHLNSNLKMPILHSFEENNLEYEDEVEIKMMGTEMDKESLEHNLHKNDITLIIGHNFSPISNPPIKLKDSGSFRMKVVEPLTITAFTPRGIPLSKWCVLLLSPELDLKCRGDPPFMRQISVESVSGLEKNKRFLGGNPIFTFPVIRRVLYFNSFENLQKTNNYIITLI
ncbi:hypothetical protein Tco_0892718 [Tanacetum coccineum]|uniref:Uncharacterized protein n=1 Tax=Tanacetum coccineum TaxID=301880 RepID=A0ABQ5C6Y8_9ASTR